MENIKKQNNEKITLLNSSQLNNEHVNLYNGYNIPFDQYQYAKIKYQIKIMKMKI